VVVWLMTKACRGVMAMILFVSESRSVSLHITPLISEMELNVSGDSKLAIVDSLYTCVETRTATWNPSIY
jgi:hypothetical protein